MASNLFSTIWVFRSPLYLIWKVQVQALEEFNHRRILAQSSRMPVGMLHNNRIDPDRATYYLFLDNLLFAKLSDKCHLIGWKIHLTETYEFLNSVELAQIRNGQWDVGQMVQAQKRSQIFTACQVACCTEKVTCLVSISAIIKWVSGPFINITVVSDFVWGISLLH